MQRSLGENIWSMDGPDITFLGARMHTRMTVVRLAGGGLWVHSPIELDAALPFIESLGETPVALVAPNKFHYLFVHQWQARWPNALVLADTALQKKVPALSSALPLTDVAHASYAQDLDQVNFLGNRLFSEVVFFHRPSGTLILTDLMINLRTDDVGLLPRLYLRFEQAEYPDGGVMRLYRWATRDKTAARRALDRVLAWQPRQITFCHGEPFLEDAQAVLRREFAWLT